MIISTRRVYVVECPTCKKPIDWSGEGGVYFSSKEDLLTNVPLWMSCEPNMTLTEYCGCKRRAMIARRKARMASKAK